VTLFSPPTRAVTLPVTLFRRRVTLFWPILGGVTLPVTLARQIAEFVTFR
jgi:hypothetical protein